MAYPKFYLEKKSWLEKSAVNDSWGYTRADGEYNIIYDGWERVGWNIFHKVHDYCGNRIEIGKENDRLFHYCDSCEIKTDRNGKTLKNWVKFIQEEK